MTTTINKPLNEAELDRLEEILDSDVFNGEGPLLDELQAMLCAIISGPGVVMASEWLPAIVGDHPAYENEAQASEILSLIMRLYNDIAAALSSGTGIEPILYPLSENGEELDFGAWADAYIYGSRIGGSDWYTAAGDRADELSELLQPLFLLNGVLKEDALENNEPWLSPDKEDQALARARESLPDLVGAIYEFWLAQRTPAPNLAGDVLMLGHEEPCPCGSGKHFKQCCGAPEKLH